MRNHVVRNDQYFLCTGKCSLALVVVEGMNHSLPSNEWVMAGSMEVGVSSTLSLSDGKNFSSFYTLFNISVTIAFDKWNEKWSFII